MTKLVRAKQVTLNEMIKQLEFTKGLTNSETKAVEDAATITFNGRIITFLPDRFRRKLPEIYFKYHKDES